MAVKEYHPGERTQYLRSTALGNIHGMGSTEEIALAVNYSRRCAALMFPC